MARLVVVTTPELAPGYALAGATTFAASDAAEAARRIEEVARSDAGIVAVHAPYLEALPDELRRRIERQVIPVVVALPAGTAGGEEARRARLAAVLAQAIGQRISFHREER